jgi:hypothetical protein
MANSKVELEIEPFILADFPVAQDEVFGVWLLEELRRLQLTVDHLTEAAPQVADRAPDLPRVGTIRWNVQPWNPLADGLEGYVQYNGSAWAALSARA